MIHFDVKPGSLQEHQLLEIAKRLQLKPILEAEDPAQKNLDAVMTVLKFDGDIPLHNDGTEAGKKSRNQADKIATEGNTALYYVTFDPPHGDVEAYVLVDGRGKVSYYDHTHNTLVFENKIVYTSTPKRIEDAIEDWVQEYRIESGKGKDGCITAYLEILKDE